jgi:hypothetical protein
MVPDNQVSDKEEYPFYPSYDLIFNRDNWIPRRYKDKNIQDTLTILKARYEIPLGDLPYFDKVGEDLRLTPMVKYVWERSLDRKADDPSYKTIKEEETFITMALNPTIYGTMDEESIEYLRFNRRSREDILGVRLDYQFTQRMAILGGFQYRKFTNRDKAFEEFLNAFPEGESTPFEYRPNQRTRIFEIQAINRGEWLGFNIVILAGYRRRTDLIAHQTANTTFVKAMMGF